MASAQARSGGASLQRRFGELSHGAAPAARRSRPSARPRSAACGGNARAAAKLSTALRPAPASIASRACAAARPAAAAANMMEPAAEVPAARPWRTELRARRCARRTPRRPRRRVASAEASATTASTSSSVTLSLAVRIAARACESRCARPGGRRRAAAAARRAHPARWSGRPRASLRRSDGRGRARHRRSRRWRRRCLARSHDARAAARCCLRSPASMTTRQSADGAAISASTAGAMLRAPALTHTARLPPNSGMVLASSTSRIGSPDSSSPSRRTSENGSCGSSTEARMIASARSRTSPASGPKPARPAAPDPGGRRKRRCRPSSAPTMRSIDVGRSGAGDEIRCQPRLDVFGDHFRARFSASRSPRARAKRCCWPGMS